MLLHCSDIPELEEQQLFSWIIKGTPGFFTIIKISGPNLRTPTQKSINTFFFRMKQDILQQKLLSRIQRNAPSPY